MWQFVDCCYMLTRWFYKVVGQNLIIFRIIGEILLLILTFKSKHLLMWKKFFPHSGFLKKFVIFQLDIDVGSSTVARGVVSLVVGYLNNLVIEMAFLVQVMFMSHSPFKHMVLNCGKCQCCQLHWNFNEVDKHWVSYWNNVTIWNIFLHRPTQQRSFLNIFLEHAVLIISMSLKLFKRNHDLCMFVCVYM